MQLGLGKRRLGLSIVKVSSHFKGSGFGVPTEALDFVTVPFSMEALRAYNSLHASQLKLREPYLATQTSTSRNDSRHLSTASFAALVKGPKFSGARTIIR